MLGNPMGYDMIAEPSVELEIKVIRQKHGRVAHARNPQIKRRK